MLRNPVMIVVRGTAGSLPLLYMVTVLGEV
jgi:hypothetical protein